MMTASLDDVVSVVEDASQCSNLEELVIECREFNTRSERIIEASRELRKRGVDILVGGIQYNYNLCCRVLQHI